MSFTHTVDGTYTTPRLLSRLPRKADIPEHHHYFYDEVWIVAKTSYYPLEIGEEHPDGLEDPAQESRPSYASSWDRGGTIFTLTSGGRGAKLYLVSEEIDQILGPLVVFKRSYSAVPREWTTRQFGYHTFPGEKVLNDEQTDLIIRSHPINLPCLIEEKHEYSLDAPNYLFKTPRYYTIGGPGFAAGAIVDYIGKGFSDTGAIVDVYPNGDGTDVRPVISVEVTRWAGRIYEIVTRTIHRTTA